MNPRLLFWVPALLRLSLVWCGGVIVGVMFGRTAGLLFAAIVATLMVILQLQYLYLLSNWLDRPDSEKMPDGWGAWTEIFSRLYKLRRDDEKNRLELTEWLARFRQAMSQLPDGVVIMDDVLFLEWCNPVAETHLGLNLERDKGMRVTNLIRHPSFMDYIILGRYEQPLTLTLRDRKLVVHIIPFENRRQILVTHDATESERIDMMRRDFIANASHELRTPLTVINGFLEIASNQPDLDQPTRLSHVKLMSEQGRRMQNLVEDMLTLTRLESIDCPLRSERVNIRALLDQLLHEANALSAGRHAISLSVDGPDIKGGTEELRSAFTNLVTNAIRYTPEQGRIDLTWTGDESGAKFIVRDSGIGIRPEHIPRLTERFYRVDKGRSRQTQGTGLGLAIVKHVLLRHHGTLVIESVLGHGSTFIAEFQKSVVYAG